MATQFKQAQLWMDIQNVSTLAGIPSDALFRKWARKALRVNAEITLRIVDEAEGRALNKEYRGKDYATNVLTFYYEQQPDQGLFIGDIAICHTVIMREAAAQKKAVWAHYAHMVVHGMLHLQGWEHESDADHHAMMRLEAHILKQLGFENPYHADDFERS